MQFQNRYQYNPKTDFINKGGFAKVYKATDTLKGIPVALKFFTAGNVSEKYSLLEEVRKAINYEHPNICRYYDIEVLNSVNAIGEEERTEVAIIEYLDGGDIKTYVQKHPESLDTLLKDVLKGLAYLHAITPKPVIHRDLKSSNILIKKTPLGPVAKICDFGISKIESSTNTKSSNLIGAIGYMAPEQFNPQRYGINGKLSTNLDFWSFGVLVYELKTQKSLFGVHNNDTSVEQVMNNILSNDYLQKLEELDEPYRSIAKRCLIKDANQRVKNAQELIDLLDGRSTNEKTQIINVGLAQEGKRKDTREEPAFDSTPVIDVKEKKTPFNSSQPKQKYTSEIFIGVGFAILLLAVILISSYNRSNDYENYDTNTADSTTMSADTMSTMMEPAPVSIDTGSIMGTDTTAR